MKEANNKNTSVYCANIPSFLPRSQDFSSIEKFFCDLAHEQKRKLTLLIKQVFLPPHLRHTQSYTGCHEKSNVNGAVN